MLLIFLHLLRDGNERGVKLRFMAHLYGLRKGKDSNYIMHVGWCL